MNRFVKRLVFELSTVGLAFMLWWTGMSDDVGRPLARLAPAEIVKHRCSDESPILFAKQQDRRALNLAGAAHALPCGRGAK